MRSRNCWKRARASIARLPEIEPSHLQNRRILIGITHEASDGSSEREQFVGTASVSDRGEYCLITVDCNDGVKRDYPFDARALERAAPGEYRLHSTGEIVRNPDFLMTWTVTED